MVRERSARVRPYTLTRGRTAVRRPLLVETCVSAVGGVHPDAVREEAREVYRACADRISIAELAVRLSMAVGVVRVLVGDLIDAGLVRAHASGQDMPQRQLLERVLHALEQLPVG
jgi:hypothetical protein